MNLTNLRLSIKGSPAVKYMRSIQRLCEKHSQNDGVRFNCVNTTNIKFYLGNFRELPNRMMNKDSVIQHIAEVVQVTKPFLYTLPHAQIHPVHVGVILQLVADDESIDTLLNLHTRIFKPELETNTYISESLKFPLFGVFVAWINCGTGADEPAQKLADEINELPFDIFGRAESILVEESTRNGLELIHTFPLNG